MERPGGVWHYLGWDKAAAPSGVTAASPVSKGRVPQVGNEWHGPLELLDFGASGFNDFPVSVLSRSGRCQKDQLAPGSSSSSPARVSSVLSPHTLYSLASLVSRRNSPWAMLSMFSVCRVRNRPVFHWFQFSSQSRVISQTCWSASSSYTDKNRELQNTEWHLPSFLLP